MKQLIFGAARGLGGFALSRRLTRGKLRILCYHGLWTVDAPPFGDRLFMPAAQFEARMRWLASSGFPVLPLGEAVEMLAADRVPDGATVITIDDGWSSTYTHMLPLFEELGLPATCYVTTYYAERRGPVVNVAVNYLAERGRAGSYDLSDIAPSLEAPIVLGSDAERDAAAALLRAALDALGFEARIEALLASADRLGVGREPWWSERQFHLMTPEEVADAARRGLDIQLHTHRHRGLHSGAGHVPQEIEDNRAALRRMLGEGARLDQFCYPSGGYVPEGEPLLKAAGVKSATLVQEGLNAPGTNPYRLRRFLDGRSIEQAHIHAYLSGALDMLERVR